MRTAGSTACVLMVCATMPVFAQSKSDTALSEAQSPKPIVVAGEKQVFIDGRFIAHSRNVALHMNQPVKQGEVLRPECPWENKSIGFCASVMEHEGVFKLFYRADSHEKGASVCLATSRDGLHWERPRIGLYEFGGNTENNIVFRNIDNNAAYRGVGETIVFFDPHGSAEQRFKMIASKGWPDPQTAGLFCHTSPDGVHWTAGPRVLDICPDTANQAAWDRQRAKYVAYLRIWNPLRKVGRAVPPGEQLMRHILLSLLLVLPMVSTCGAPAAMVQDPAARVAPELIVDVDVNDEVYNRAQPLTEDDIKTLVTQLKQNGCQTLLVRCGFLGLLPYHTALSYPIHFDVEHARANHAPVLGEVDEFLPRSTQWCERYAETLRNFNPPAVFIRECHAQGMKVLVWLDIFDDGYPGFRSKFLDEHPHCQWVGRDGKTYFKGLSEGRGDGAALSRVG